MTAAKTTPVVLILLMASVLPASANHFANPQWGLNLNVGSAPNPVPRDRVQLAEAPPPIIVAPPAAPPPPPPLPPAVQEPPQFAPAPPPPAAAPASRRFILFFDFDRAELTEEGRLIVRQAVAEARRQGSVRVLVTGHTDTVGSRAYNQRLSERRALAVKNEMVRGGLDPGEITTVGRNFANPLIATGPGVREPQNRRAVIDIGGLIS